MSAQVPPIVKASERLVVEIEKAVRGFDRYHRYQIGSELRDKAAQVYDLADRAWRDRTQQRRWVRELRWAVDRLRNRLQVAQLLRATCSFRQFEHLARLVDALGKQVGGWHKHLHPKGQNAQGQGPVAQRAQILSTRAASEGANP